MFRLEGMLLIKSLWRRRRFATLFVAALTLGLFGLVLIEAFKHAVERSIHESSRNYLTADLGLNARRELTEEEKQVIHSRLPTNTQAVQVTDLVTMAAGPQHSQLVQLRSIEPGYPFYGTIHLRRQGIVDSNQISHLLNGFKVWVYPEILVQMDLSLGDSIKIGESEFIIDDVIEEDVGPSFGFTGMAPRVYINAESLGPTKLVAKKGTTLTYHFLYRLPEDVDLEAIAAAMKSEIKDPGVRIQTHKDASEQTGRSLNYLNDYLGLVSIVALFLAAIGASYLFRNYLINDLKTVAICKSLGLDSSKLISIYLWQLVILGIVTFLPLTVIVALALPLLKEGLTLISPYLLSVDFPWQAVFSVVGLAVVISLMVGGPYLLPLKKLGASFLFQEDQQPSLSFSPTHFVLYSPAALLFWGLSVWQSHSFLTGSLFVVGFLLSAFVISTLGLYLARTAGRMWAASWSRRLALIQLSRHRLSSVSSFLALGLGSLLISFLAVIQAGLQEELKNPKGQTLPNLFLIDIQEEQLEALKELIGVKNLHVSMVSPFIRARLEKVNDKKFEKSDEQNWSREGDEATRFRNRGVNLSYRSQLFSSEQIVAGRFWQSAFEEGRDPWPEISVEKRFAERLDLKLGDLLTFDIQGIEVQGKITSLRKVKWNSFQPNFFIQFQPGVLDGAPKTYIATMGGLESHQVAEVQNQIVREFPNISVIDVRRVVEKITDIVNKVAWALRSMALLALGSGLFVLYAIIQNQILQRRRDINLLKILGASKGSLGQVVIWQFILLSGVAASFGVLLSWLLGYLFSVYFFDSSWVIPWVTVLLIPIVVMLMTTMLAWISTRSVLRAKPVEFLN